MDAKKTGFVMYNKYSNDVEYEYRGYKYFVEFPTCNNYGCTSPKLQHEIEQEKIDRLIDEKNKFHEPFNFDKEMKKIFEMLEWD